jgi:hypothetical protein
VQVAGRVNTSCIICLLQIYLACALAFKRAACANRVCCLGDCCRVTSYPRFPLPRRNPKLGNLNPKHHDYVYDLDANPSDGAGQRTE